jgi:hypothetical protein
MRIVEPTLMMFLNEVGKVEPLRARVEAAANNWLWYKNQRDKYGRNNSEAIQDARASLENCLGEYRRELSKIYDMMADRGLVDFESSIVTNGSEESSGLEESEEGARIYRI